jgi:hypothetical protein
MTKAYVLSCLFIVVFRIYIFKLSSHLLEKITIMKKIFTTLLIVMSACSLTQAQVTKGQTEFGVGIGYNSAYVIASNSSESSGARTGFNFGVSADHYFSDRWSIKAKAIYDQKGWGKGFLATPSRTYENISYKTTYITIPVMANWHFGKTRNWYLNFGPYLGILANATATEDNIDVKSILNTTDGGIALGIGVKIPVSNTTKFYIEFDGQGGAANVIKGGAVVSDNLRNSRSSFNIGLNF